MTSKTPRRSAEQDAPDEPTWFSYSINGTTDGGDQIADVLQRTHKCFVFINQTGQLQWEFVDGCVGADRFSSDAMRLIAQVNTSVVLKRTRRKVFGVIADALAAALDNGVEDDQRDYFEHARSIVNSIRVESLHVIYLTSAAVAAGIIVPLLLIMPVSDSFQPFCVSSALATVGALLSVLMRFRSIPIETYTSHVYTAIGGVSRVVLGTVFGSVFLLFHQADLLLTAIHTIPALRAASLLAGFSERLVPDLLASFEPKATETPRA